MDDPNTEQTLPEKGRVNRVRQEWLVHEDGVLAHNLQEKEFGDKYQWNRQDRQTARTDVPLAKYVQTEEEMEQQKQRMEILQRQKQIAERDAEMAVKVQEIEKAKQKLPEKRVKDDSIVAQQFQQEEMINLERERIRQELRDEEYARLLQEKEKRYADRRQKQRELAQEKRVLEHQQQQLAQSVLPGYNNIQQSMAGLSLDADAAPKLRPDGRVEDVGDFSDFYIQPSDAMPVTQRKELQELQDEELARLLQDQERKRGAQVKKSALKELEARDAEIARVMQEQEKLKYRKKHKHRFQSEGNGADHGPPPQYGQYQSQGARADPSQGPPPQYGRYQSDPGHNRPPVLPAKSYEQQNMMNDYMNVRNGSSPHTNGSMPTSDPAGEVHAPHYQGQSPYTTRPLPETPDEALMSNITVVPVDTNQFSPPGSPSPPPPGYKPPPAYPNKRQQEAHQRRSNESTTSGNVIASIDPTFRDQHEHYPPYHLQGDSPPGTHQHHQGIHGTEDGYCDLDDLGPVQGQRRMNSGDRRDSKKNNCKQQ